MTDVLLQVAAAISMGGILMTPTHSVGPYRIATSRQALWACLDKQGAPLTQHQVTRKWEPDPHLPYPRDLMFLADEDVWEQDWSAFAAARAFVAAVGERKARAALKGS
jgi:hypothetical protein